MSDGLEGCGLRNCTNLQEISSLQVPGNRTLLGVKGMAHIVNIGQNDIENDQILSQSVFIPTSSKIHGHTCDDPESVCLACRFFRCGALLANVYSLRT